MAKLLFDRAYFEDRLQRCNEQAASASTPSTRDLYLQYADYYAYVLRVKPSPIRQILWPAASF